MATISYFVVLIALLPTVLCCGNMNVDLIEVNVDCLDGCTSIFDLSEDFGFTLSDNCTLSPLGCVEIKKNFSIAKLHYKVSTSIIPSLEGDHDACELMSSASKCKEIDLVMNLFQFPKSCPVTAATVCAENKTVSMEKYKDKLPLSSGNVKGEIVIDHGDVGKSCLNFVLNIAPKPFKLT